MTRIHAATALAAALAFAAAACPTPGLADQEMKQSPLLMRRAGPSCQPGDLGGDPGAGYRYQLGPCAGPDPSSVPAGMQRSRGRRRGS